MQRSTSQRFTSKVLTRPQSILSGALGLLFCSILTFQAQAGTVTVFSLPFTLTNVNADGSEALTNGGLSLVLTGGNNGSGLSGTTDFTTSATGPGTVAFDFAYSSLDDPGFDSAGYTLGGIFAQFADTDGETGHVVFAVSGGQVFGFEVDTADNQGEPGILTISNFSGPGNSVPEPGTLPLALVGALATVIVKVKMRRARTHQKSGVHSPEA